MSIDNHKLVARGTHRQSLINLVCVAIIGVIGSLQRQCACFPLLSEPLPQQDKVKIPCENGAGARGRKEKRGRGLNKGRKMSREDRGRKSLGGRGGKAQPAVSQQYRCRHHLAR